MLLTRDTYIVQNTFMAIILIICGITFPINFLPIVIQGIGMVFPLTPALIAFRNCIIANQSLYENIDLIVLALLSSIIFTILGIFILKKIEKGILQGIYS